ncbi:hypothetical protein [Photobacterium leiognathi]|uniref:hypothetical protein n=1 Tax=Photobacterium leiognathi TaxID=553611 RepID=UPI00298174FA|nr:hypothetical protein [Photobacterium leiognathi]
MVKRSLEKDMAADQVDRKGFRLIVDCDRCSGPAVQRHFESAHSGSVNQYSITNCGNCGYHHCDLDTCHRCDGE